MRIRNYHILHRYQKLYIAIHIDIEQAYSWQPTGQMNAEDGNDNLKSNFSLRVACCDYSNQTLEITVVHSQR